MCSTADGIDLTIKAWFALLMGIGVLWLMDGARTTGTLFYAGNPILLYFVARGVAWVMLQGKPPTQSGSSGHETQRTKANGKEFD